MVQIPLSQHPRGNKIICGVKYSKGSEKHICIDGNIYSSDKLSIIMDPQLLHDRFELIVTTDGRLILTQSEKGNIGFRVSSDITLSGTSIMPSTQDYIQVSWNRTQNKTVQRCRFYVPLTKYDAQ